MSEKNPVKLLNPEVARKIAAGEVIDRPNAIIRELMDNAIDSGANKITVEIASGGIEKIRIVDDGCGMTKEDLQTCAQPHATSKISTETDLLNLTTLGFRGEALASISSVCRLSITSGGYKMRSSITEDNIVEPTTPTEGTIVQAEGLFENFPARRVFLKRPSAEGTMCKNTFIEKTLPCPEKAFRFVSDGEIKLDLAPNQSLKERFVKAMELKEDISLFNEISASAIGQNPDWSFKLIIGEPSVFRSSKKDIYIFVNGRKITEYSLVQAIEYGCQGYFPNGTYPVAAVFVNINPSLVDFNIHPAKKEARFKDISDLHHGISSKTRLFFQEYTNKTMVKKSIPEDSPQLFTQEETSVQTTQKPFAEKTYTTEPKLSGYQRFAKSYNNSTSNKEILSDVREKFFTNYNKTEQYTYETPKVQYKSSFDDLEKVNSNDEQTLQAETKNATKEKVLSLVNKALEAYNSFQNQEEDTFAKTEEINHPQEIITITPSNEISQKTNIEVPIQNEVTTETQNFNEDSFHFVGSTLGTFIIAEQNNILYIIDKHAAHERILYNKIIQTKGQKQELLVPYTIKTQSDDEDKYLESIQESLIEIGFTCKNCGNGNWEFTSIQERWTGSEEDLQHALLDEKVKPEEIIYSIAATAACKAAVKDGYTLDDDTASKIAKEALLLPDPHCPHGRPVYTTISREQLFALVRRT